MDRRVSSCIIWLVSICSWLKTGVSRIKELWKIMVKEHDTIFKGMNFNNNYFPH